MEKSNLFGGVLNTIGTTSADLILKTRGNVKVLMGSKFVDLFRNGKVLSQMDVPKGAIIIWDNTDIPSGWQEYDSDVLGDKLKLIQKI